ncbi:neuromedin U [Halomicronema sp. CCY15110]|uniref:neuromedin U n=1 Tax=Halomicronema sp. CCY15110 TaxID=2767773 RepID=UPI00194E51FD|nr:neuromedin U [Halomicronema sp. CCY15110]
MTTQYPMTMKYPGPFTRWIRSGAIATVAVSATVLSTTSGWTIEPDTPARFHQNSMAVAKPVATAIEKPAPVALPWAVSAASATTESAAVASPLANEALCTVSTCLSLSPPDPAQAPALVAFTEPETAISLPDSTTAIAQAADGEASGQADLAKASQNPIASLISVPLQNNTNFGVGEFDRTSNILNVQPVIPVPLSDSLTLVNRTIVPIAYQPELAPGLNSAFGLGDINYTGFFVPNTTGNFTWGVGPSIVLPTATDTVLGTGKWSVGPAAVGLVSQGPIVAGALVSQLWSFAGDDDRSDVSLLTIQPFFNYNFEGGWYATTSPIISANWEADDDTWTLPIGGGAGRVFNIGRQPVNASVQAYWNVIKPDGAADWTLRAQLTLLFP